MIKERNIIVKKKFYACDTCTKESSILDDLEPSFYIPPGWVFFHLGSTVWSPTRHYCSRVCFNEYEQKYGVDYHGWSRYGRPIEE
jgi:hypothetical protein